MQHLPLVNVHSTNDAIEFRLALPGLTKTDLDVYCDGRSLVVSHVVEDAGEHICPDCAGPGQEKRTWDIPSFEYRAEFSRNLTVVACSMEHGVLTIVLMAVNNPEHRVVID